MATEYRTVAAHLASMIDAENTCIERGNTEWEDRWGRCIELVRRECLPSGSGVDNGTQIDLIKTTPDKLILECGYHHMDENGYYAGWTSHMIVVKPTFTGLSVRVGGPNRNQIKEYLSDLYREALFARIDVDAIAETITWERVP